MKRTPISELCNMQPEGWTRMPDLFSMAPFGEEQYSCCFIRGDGIQFVATMKYIGTVPVIHVSIAPMYTLRPDLSRAKLEEHVMEEVFDILEAFFGERRFARMPEDPRLPVVKHYFHYME